MNIYQYDKNRVYTGVSRRLRLGEGRPTGWTRREPPIIPAGQYAHFLGHQSGWQIIGTYPEEQKPIMSRIGTIDFMLRFTPVERIAIRAARETDPVVDDLMRILDDPRTSVVDVSMQSNIDAIDYLIAQGHVAPERRNALLSPL